MVAQLFHLTDVERKTLLVADAAALMRFPVGDRKAADKLIGTISLNNLLRAPVQNFEAERRRERFVELPRIGVIRKADADEGVSIE